MALIEGVGDEVTLLFGLVFVVLVLVLAWASTRTVDGGHQDLQATEDTPAAAPEQRESACTTPPTEGTPNQGVTSANASEAEVEREEQEVEREEQEVEAEREEEQKVEEKQEREKGSEAEEEITSEHETSPTEKGAEGLVTENVPELDTSPPDTGQLRQRVTTASGGEDPETVSAGEQPPPTDSPNQSAEGSIILLRLKFLNDTERIARVRAEDTIGHIKRVHFPHQEHQVRLIYQGQLLGDDTQTLSSLHVVNNCVMHCHISQNATLQSPAGSHAAEHTEPTLNIGGLMLPVFFLMLSVLWYYQINYRQFFTAPATISLVGITILFSFVAFGAYRR